jgi:ubiquinone/menaquinone biosynthesis C-methylase UbiE
MKSSINEFVKPDVSLEDKGVYLSDSIPNPSEAIIANAYYFGQQEWAEEYLKYCHREETFIRRWNAAIGSWDDKVVVDIGCGPGNIFASLQGKPKVLIGVDVAPKSLEIASSIGYTPLLADATHLPFKSGIADVVVLNAALHHCEHMEDVLAEAARIVKPGGLLVTDHDPQLSAWNYKGVAKLLWNIRLIVYKILGKGFHKTDSQQHWGLACEIHHKPGHGVTKELFETVLQPEGFDVRVYPHNHTKGEEVIQGELGKASFKYRLGNLLSGRNPGASKSALTLMCIARKSPSIAY